MKKRDFVKLWQLATVLLLTLLLMSGCGVLTPKKELVVISSDREIIFQSKGSSITLSNDYWLVPPAMMIDLFPSINPVP
jgi:hypothetical protein